MKTQICFVLYTKKIINKHTHKDKPQQNINKPAYLPQKSQSITCRRTKLRRDGLQRLAVGQTSPSERHLTFSKSSSKENFQKKLLNNYIFNNLLLAIDDVFCE